MAVRPLEAASQWCKLVNVTVACEVRMKKNARTKKVVRASVSFSPDDYAGLERVADAMKVSIAWVVRDAVTQYLKAELRAPTIASQPQNRTHS
jgi:hypothetical protein